MKIRILFYLVFLLGFSIEVQAQLEGSNKKIKLSIVPPKEKTPKTNLIKKEIFPKTSQVIKYEPEFFKPKDPFNYVSTVPKVGEIAAKKYEVKSAQDLFETQNQERESSVGFAYESDTFLGEYIVYTDKVLLKYRDYGAVDGDNIRIILNGQVVKDYVTLQGSFDSFELNLNEGSNIVQIQALNTGQFFPNTGNFIFFDGNYKLVVNQNWGLTEGYKAIVKITRRKGLTEVDPNKKE